MQETPVSQKSLCTKTIFLIQTSIWIKGTFWSQPNSGSWMTCPYLKTCFQQISMVKIYETLAATDWKSWKYFIFMLFRFFFHFFFKFSIIILLAIFSFVLWFAPNSSSFPRCFLVFSVFPAFRLLLLRNWDFTWRNEKRNENIWKKHDTKWKPDKKEMNKHDKYIYIRIYNYIHWYILGVLSLWLRNSHKSKSWRRALLGLHVRPSVLFPRSGATQTLI